MLPQVGGAEVGAFQQGSVFDAEIGQARDGIHREGFGPRADVGMIVILDALPIEGDELPGLHSPGRDETGKRRDGRGSPRPVI